MFHLPESRKVRIAPGYAISPIIVGGWQLSRGHGGGFPAGESPRRFLSELVARGFTTFDCADIYTGVEELLGDFLRHHSASGSDQPVQVHTKFVPDLDILPTIHRGYVERIIHRSLSRLGVEVLDLVQFHWWNFGVPGYVEVMGWLQDLKAAGKIRHLAVTNFDRAYLAELVDAGAEVVSDQVQYSVLDRRPARDLASYCLDQDIKLLCYGALAGGFLTGRYLGVSEPPRELENRSLAKYRLVIEEIGGWPRYQAVLEALAEAASQAGVSVAAFALRWVLDRPAVAATITGIDTLAHADELRTGLEMAWEPETRRTLDRVLGATPVPPGPVYGVERVVDGPHGSIMRYDLNRE